MTKKEKGDNKEAALWALARTEAPEAADFWREQVEKDFATAVQHMIYSDSYTAADLTAGLFRQELEEPDGDPKRLEEHLKNLLYALAGKTGKAVCGVYRRAAVLKTALDGNRMVMVNGQPVDQTMLFWCSIDRSSQPFSVAIADTLARSIQTTGDPMLCELAEELYEQYGGLWAGPALIAALLTKSGEEAEAMGKKILTPGLLQKLTGGQKRQMVEKMVFGRLMGRGSLLPCYQAFDEDPAVCVVRAFSQGPVYTPIAAPLDGWWFNFFIKQNMEQQLRALVDPSDPELRQKVGAYFDRRIRMGSLEMNLTAACIVLENCGWQDWKGFMVDHVLHSPRRANYWEVRNVLERCPLSSKEKGEELAEIYAKGRVGGWPEKAVEKQIEDWLAG